MSQFLSEIPVKIGETEYQPASGIITVPDGVDVVAVNRLGLSRYIAAPSTPAQHEEAQA